MIKRIFIFAMLVLMAIIFFNLAANYSEKSSLSKLGAYYVEKGPQEIGAPNLVTAVVVTYRGLDTLGEVRRKRRDQGEGTLQKDTPVEADPETANVYKPASEIVETATELLLPMVILFGVYVFLNGHLSPGGGFQGGAIIASGTMFLLLALPESHLSRDCYHRITVRLQLCCCGCAWRDLCRRFSRQPFHLVR